MTGAVKEPLPDLGEMRDCFTEFKDVFEGWLLSGGKERSRKTTIQMERYVVVMKDIQILRFSYP